MKSLAEHHPPLKSSLIRSPLAPVLKVGAKLCALGLAFAVAQSTAQASMLVNGDFELGPPGPYNYSTLAGWTGAVFDPNYRLLATTINPAPPGSSWAPSSVYEGDYGARRILYSGTGVSEILFLSSDTYNLASYSNVSAGDTLSLSLTTQAQGQGGRYENYGRITFYDAAKNAIGSFETSRLISAGTASWNTLSVEALIPDNAVSFRVFGVINISTALNGTGYSSFDNFVVTPIPEPGTVALMASALAIGGAAAWRRRNRK